MWNGWPFSNSSWIWLAMCTKWMNHFLLATLEKWSEIDQWPAVILHSLCVCVCCNNRLLGDIMSWKLSSYQYGIACRCLNASAKTNHIHFEGATSTSHRVWIQFAHEWLQFTWHDLCYNKGDVLFVLCTRICSLSKLPSPCDHSSTPSGLHRLS